MPQFDSGRIRTGKDGVLSWKGKALLEVNTWALQANFSNGGFIPAGESVEQAIPQSVGFTLTFEEAYVTDALPLEIITAIKSGKRIMLDFQGKIAKDGGGFQSTSMRKCVPDGAIDLLSIKPGDYIRKAYSFRVNQVPDIDNPIR